MVEPHGGTRQNDLQSGWKVARSCSRARRYLVSTSTNDRSRREKALGALIPSIMAGRGVRVLPNTRSGTRGYGLRSRSFLIGCAPAGRPMTPIMMPKTGPAIRTNADATTISGVAVATSPTAVPTHLAAQRADQAVMAVTATATATPAAEAAHSSIFQISIELKGRV